MCDPISAAVLAIGQGVMQYQADVDAYKYSNKVADAQNEAAHKAFEDTGRALNAREWQEQLKIGDERMGSLIKYMENMGSAQVALDARGITGGRTAEFDLLTREADFLKTETQSTRQIDAVQTAYSFERQGLSSTLQNRLMTNNAQRKPKPSAGRAIAMTALNAGMAYAGANSGTAGGPGGTTNTFKQNWSTFKSNFTV